MGVVCNGYVHAIEYKVFNYGKLPDLKRRGIFKMKKGVLWRHPYLVIS